jgi:two-component system nitrogen regulation response regulator NtrX
MARSILIVDDEADIQSSLAFALKDEGFDVLTAGSPKEAQEILGTKAVDIGLFDVWFPDGDGVELLQFTREAYPDAVVVMMSGHGNIELALKAIRLGAYDFLEKPLELEKLLVILKNVTESLDLRDENRRLSKRLLGHTNLIGESQALKSLQSDVRKAAASSAHVLISGENGTGKELVARLLHQSSSRARYPFVTVTCANLSEATLDVELFGSEDGGARHIGRLEQAGEGTVFLDEILELGASAQAKLLRVLEDRSFRRVGGSQTIRLGARVLAASNRDLADAVKEGKLREDLYFRLKVLSVSLPPLRERGQDVPLLAKHFVEELSREYGRAPPPIGEDLAQWLVAYDWPGNVRELRNLLERMIIMGGGQEKLGVADLPEELQLTRLSPGVSGGLEPVRDPAGPLRELRAQFEKMILEQRLERFQGNVTRAAESLGIERAHLHRKMKQYGLSSGHRAGDS